MKVPEDPVVITLSILGYKLNAKQNALINYLVPSVLGTLFHIAHLTVDSGCVYSQYREGNVVWANMTVLIFYIPVLGSFLLTVTSWEMWPGENCNKENILWFLWKFVQHLFFPAWNMWRCAEKIFWSIEGWLAINEDYRAEALGKVTAPRTIEFYYFLQGFLHTVPQILLQITLLIHHLTDFRQETNQVAAISIVLNITRMALTTSLYQRFKTQKVGGRNYPWFKSYKYDNENDILKNKEDTVDAIVRMRDPSRRRSTRSNRSSKFCYCTRDTLYNMYTQIEMDKLVEKQHQHTLIMERRRRSSAGYLKPVDCDVDASNFDSDDESEVFKVEREYSKTYDKGIHSTQPPDEIDFPRPIRFVTSIPEDDLVGKLVAFLWWFLFLTARFLSIVSFAFFYTQHIIWILAVHFCICVAYLMYDVQTYIIRRTKAVFFIFIGAIYIFCIIEFKKKFKKYNVVYNSYCALVFGENLIMTLVWWNVKKDNAENEWWLDYVFYTVIGSTLLGVMSLLVYNIVNRPEKIIIGAEVIEKS